MVQRLPIGLPVQRDMGLTPAGETAQAEEGSQCTVTIESCLCSRAWEPRLLSSHAANAETHAP